MGATMETYRKAMKTFSKSWKMMLSIMLIFFPIIILIFLKTTLAIIPLLNDLASNSTSMRNLDPKSQDSIMALLPQQEDITKLMGIEGISITISFISSLLFNIAIVHTAAMAYSDKKITMKDLFFGIMTSWKGSLATNLWFAILNLGCLVFFVFFIVLIPIVVMNGSPVVLGLGLLLGLFLCLLAVFLGFYLNVVFFLGFVVSVVEKDCYGLQALGRASEVISWRKKQAFALFLFPWMVSVVLISIFMLTTGEKQDARLIGGVALNMGGFLLHMFIFVVFTIFYCDSADSGHKKPSIEINYENLPVVDKDLP